jgi:hypothetical protein
MPQFFTISHNSFHKVGFPWISSLTEGFGQIYYCKTCDRSLHYASGQIAAILERHKGSKWSDILGCGAFPFFIVSGKVIESWEKEGIGSFPIHKVIIQSPLPKKLVGTAPPDYYWIDGGKLKGALMDFEASGFVDVKFCPECGTRTNNISATFKRQHSLEVCRYVFRPSSWNGLHLFTTDISDTAFFCTEAVVNCAKKYGLTNFRFIPIDEGINAESKGLTYL